MASANKCIGCSKSFSRKQNKQLKYSKCSYFLHLSSTLISKNIIKITTMETRILYVITVKTAHVLLAISMFMIGKKGFSVAVVKSGFTENVLDWLNRNMRN